jgi:drug/metabolite transporter (DMT)-like permease
LQAWTKNPLAAGAFGAKAFLGERITRHRWLGIAIVSLGVTLVWLSHG